MLYGADGLRLTDICAFFRQTIVHSMIISQFESSNVKHTKNELHSGVFKTVVSKKTSLKIIEREKRRKEENKKKLWCDVVKALNGEDSFSYRSSLLPRRSTNCCSRNFFVTE
jgi:hypothetical protein